ncbi:aminotransferase class III-fold pyridoxal phosphate-dependent enzyme [Moorena bouillonii]|uniref:aminotransferase class III-fold pyridoxal phosphate-dependent enzyme n=1 Tax=Moorena bouillonii TaxID=207920 RepID=UPI00096AC058|nr:aminotransferase class III-fold pyridoxal phosphate-dependent enzyme [Moorena bouillonii]
MSQNTLKFLDRNQPQFPEAFAKQLALTHYGLEGTFAPLYSERDQNFRIESESGDKVVFKISNSAESIEVIEYQTAALRYLEEQDPELSVPRVILTNGGEPFTMMEGPDGTSHIMRVLSYVPGDIAGSVPRSMAQRRSLGRYLARLDLALRGFFHPAARNEHPWDLTRSTAYLPHVDHVPDPEVREHIRAILEHHRDVVLPKMRTLRHQVVHADGHGRNCLIDPADPDTITGLLDFGDMVFAPLIVELAIANDVGGLDADAAVDVMANMAAGFDEVMPLEEAEIDLIYDLTLTRLAATSVIIAWRRAETPEQEGFHTDDEAKYWHAMVELRRLGRDEVSRRIRKVCRFPSYVSESLSDERSQLIGRRHGVLDPSLRLFYANPIHVERGQGPWLFSPSGKRYLDAYNNVVSVGHCHPHVVRAVSRQMAALNTNTRYLYEIILDYAERLTSTMGDNLAVCTFVNSGSEANDVAWRFARHFTGRSGGLIVEGAYHGITGDIADFSPGRSGAILAPHMEAFVSPDPYTGPYGYDAPDVASLYAADSDRAIEDMRAKGLEPAAFMIDSSFVSNGIPGVPAGYLQKVTEKARAAGALIIADEVQAGFGRSGTHLWGHQAQGIVPDIVTLGKPVGNGFPLGVVITRPEILNAFMTAKGLFSTFGGNPVACAAGNAVLDVIENEGLIENAGVTGKLMGEGISALMDKYEILGDVRQRGMLVGAELVKDRESRAPATEETVRLLDLLVENGVLVGKSGVGGNVLKIRPPLVFRPEHAEIFVDALDRSLASL